MLKSLHQFNLTRSPGLVEPGLGRAIEPQEASCKKSGHTIDPFCHSGKIALQSTVGCRQVLWGEFSSADARSPRGYRDFTATEAYETGSEVLGSQRFTGAVPGRLTHHCHIMEATGKSYRLKDAKSLRLRTTPATEPIIKTDSPPMGGELLSFTQHQAQLQ